MCHYSVTHVNTYATANGFACNDKQCVFHWVTLYFLFFLLGDNNGWPHLFDNYFGIPSNNLGTKSNACCEYSLIFIFQRFNLGNSSENLNIVEYLYRMFLLEILIACTICFNTLGSCILFFHMLKQQWQMYIAIHIIKISMLKVFKRVPRVQV